jgi:D-alanyl-D-alanine carboxypeptidase
LAAAIGAALLAAALATSSAQAQGHLDNHNDTQQLLDAYQANAGPGAVVVAGNRTTTWSAHSGTGQVGVDRPIQSTDRARVASQSKPFAAAVVLQLVAEGKIELDAPIERYLPGMITGNGYDGNKITVRNLLQHTSGLAEYASVLADQTRTYTPSELVRIALRTKPTFQPGSGWEYSNTNFVVIAMLIERITGQSINDALNARIIQPLGLTQTRLPQPGDRSLGDPFVHGYFGIPVLGVVHWIDITTNFEPSYWSTAGGVVSTPVDMVTFVQALADGVVVPRTQLAEMRKVVSGASMYDGYGLGLTRLKLSCGGEAWGHPGDLAGYSSLTMATDDGRHASIVTNTMVNTILPSVTREKVIDSAICGS